jgi:OPA family glycerol-3-phosphate transporter-like MFS transporter
LVPLLTSFTFWIVCVMNVGLTLIRETFNLWNPTFLKEEAKLGSGSAAMASFAFPLVGAISALLAGWVADRRGGRYAGVVIVSMVALVAVLVALSTVPLNGRPWLASLLIGAVAFFLLAPYTFCSGVLAVKLGGQRGGATAAGIIDTAGYLGAVMSGSVVGRIADAYGWGSAFASLAAVAGVTLAVAAVYALRSSRSPSEQANGAR